MTFSKRFGPPQERLNWVAGNLRDLVVNVADYLRVPVDSVNLSYASKDHAFTWKWLLHIELENHVFEAARVELDEAIEEAKRKLEVLKKEGKL